ncbi:hypothetical protein, partial [Agathobaculum sp.]|uniref:hypothetical protein n=1 Tax=Agathobaculum sp. TaxID=2048138 RepID=UPI003AB120B2
AMRRKLTTRSVVREFLFSFIIDFAFPFIDPCGTKLNLPHGTLNMVTDSAGKVHIKYNVFFSIRLWSPLQIMCPTPI